MSDWADEQAKEMWEDGGHCGGVSASTIAAALRAAEKRGRIAGLREGANDVLLQASCLCSARLLRRADELEKQQAPETSSRPS